MSANDFKKLSEFEILNIGIFKGGDTPIGCGPDADRLCTPSCPTSGCKHDGCCAPSSWDHKGDTACGTNGEIYDR